LQVRDAQGKVISTWFYGDSFSPAVEPQVLRLEPAERFTSALSLLGNVPVEARRSGRYTVQASFQYKSLRAVSDPMEFDYRSRAGTMDDLALALRVEEEYPVLNDALASTVQFLQEPAKEETSGSPSLQREAVRRAMRLAENCDFNKVIDRRGLGVVALSVLLLV